MDLAADEGRDVGHIPTHLLGRFPGILRRGDVEAKLLNDGTVDEGDDVRLRGNLIPGGKPDRVDIPGVVTDVIADIFKLVGVTVTRQRQVCSVNQAPMVLPNQFNGRGHRANGGKEHFCGVTPEDMRVPCQGEEDKRHWDGIFPLGMEESSRSLGHGTGGGDPCQSQKAQHGPYQPQRRPVMAGGQCVEVKFF
ncbi:hypothetical protein ES707_15847 [subsurface metagenome]